MFEARERARCDTGTMLETLRRNARQRGTLYLIASRFPCLAGNTEHGALSRSGMADHDPECVFCKIVAGELPARVIEEDERTIAFLDISPATPGHAVVIPRAHTPDVTTASYDVAHSGPAPVSSATATTFDGCGSTRRLSTPRTPSGAPASTVARSRAAASGAKV